MGLIPNDPIHSAYILELLPCGTDSVLDHRRDGSFQIGPEHPGKSPATRYVNRIDLYT